MSEPCQRYGSTLYHTSDCPTWGGGMCRTFGYPPPLSTPRPPRAGNGSERFEQKRQRDRLSWWFWTGGSPS